MSQPRTAFLRKGAGKPESRHLKSKKAREKTRSPLLTLGPDLIVVVLSYLTGSRLCRIERTSRALAMHVNSSVLWRIVYIRRFGSHAKTPKNTGDSRAWKRLYLKHAQQRSHERMSGLVKKYRRAISMGGLPKTKPLMEQMEITLEVMIDGQRVPSGWRAVKVTPHTVAGKATPLSQGFGQRTKHDLQVWARSAKLMRAVLLIERINQPMPFEWGRLTPPPPKGKQEGQFELYDARDGLVAGVLDEQVVFFIVNVTHVAILSSFLADIHPPHRVICDDVDPTYGLHDYTCAVALRNTGKTFWSNVFSGVHYRKTGDNYKVGGVSLGEGVCTAVFHVRRRQEEGMELGFNKTLSFPWKSNAFSGAVDNVCILDFSVWDEHSQPVWAFSKGVTTTSMNDTLTMGQAYEDGAQPVNIRYAEKGVGSVAVDLVSYTAQKRSAILAIKFELELAFIDTKFGTSYSKR